jgi:hypothetical protein
MRDNKVLELFKKKIEKNLKEMNIFKHLRKEVDHGANGTQGYVIKKGINKGKVANNFMEINMNYYFTGGIIIAFIILTMIASPI